MHSVLRKRLLWQASPLPSGIMGHQWWCFAHGEHTRSEVPIVCPTPRSTPFNTCASFYSRCRLLLRRQEMWISGWGTQGSSMEHLCRSLSFLPQTGCCTLFWASEAVCLGWSPYVWRGFLGCRNLSSFPAASQCGARKWEPPFSFILSSYVKIFLASLGVWDILPEFSRFSMRIVPCVGVFFFF